jgi:hypothetical protein
MLRLSALRTGRSLLPTNIISSVLEAEAEKREMAESLVRKLKGTGAEVKFSLRLSN